MAIPLNFYVDVSGQPQQRISVGISSINVNKMSIFIKELKKRYPRFIRSKQKSSKIKDNQIMSLVNYFNGQKIYMKCVCFGSSSWLRFRELRQRKQYWKEMIYAVLYFYGLKRLSVGGNTYQITVCHETYLDIEKVKNYLKKLGKAYRYNYQVSSSYASQCDMIKVSDLIAGAGKKLGGKILNNLDNYELLTPSISEIKYFLKVLEK